MQRLVYHLTVQSDGLVQAEFSSPGRDNRREAPLDLAQLTHLQGHLSDVARQPQQTRAKLVTLGRYLYQLLLTGSVRAHFEEVVWPLVVGPPTTGRLTFTLAFQESDSRRISQAAVLPWEFIYYPQGSGTFLATDPRLCFTRRDRRPPAAAEPLHGAQRLRVLLVHLQPDNAAPVSLARIRNVLHELAQEERAARPLTPVLLPNPTPAQLAEKLTMIRPHLLHLLLHGQFAPDSTRFGFVDEQGQTRWYGDRSLANLFDQQQPQLVIVQACEGGRLSDANSLAHGAARLLAAGVPAVVAMQYPITNEVGWEFAEAFYRQLAAGAAVDTAVQAGRRHLAQYDLSLPDDHASRNFGAVVLWQPPLRIAPEKERGKMSQTVTLVAPDGKRYASQVSPDTLVGDVVGAFVGQWQPAPAHSTQYTLHLQGPDTPPLDVASTLAQAGVPASAVLWLTAEPLSADEPVGLTIEDEQGEQFGATVLLNMTVQKLANDFLATRPVTTARHPVVILVAGPPEMASERPISLQTTLYEEGISQYALLRIKTVPVQVEGQQ